jgi:hypothetical protein
MATATAPAPALLTREEIELLEPECLGPTWAKNPDGSWNQPRWTTGWQIAARCADYLLAEDGGPWRFTPESSASCPGGARSARTVASSIGWACCNGPRDGARTRCSR